MVGSKRVKALSCHLLPSRVGSSWEAVGDESLETGLQQKHQLQHVDANGNAIATRVGITFEYEDEVIVPSRRRVRVRWHDPVRRVLLIKKWHNQQVTAVAMEVAAWLKSHEITIFVEPSHWPDYKGIAGVLALDVNEGSRTAVDLVVSMGGDGTLLHASRLFRFLDRCLHELLPPCLVLGLGSLGFLASVAAADWKLALMGALRGNVDPVPCTLRTRLRCILQSPDGRHIATWYALNECVVLSRGNAIGKLRLSVDGTFVTLVEGDGIIVSSPTGSTGYSLSCGGPIVSPSVPCTLLTPIAPASLSFRPLLISELSSVEVLLPSGARTGHASVVLDGREMGKLERGSRVLVAVARPIPVLNVAGLDRDWFDAITSKLKWNVRDVEQADIND